MVQWDLHREIETHNSFEHQWWIGYHRERGEGGWGGGFSHLGPENLLNTQNNMQVCMHLENVNTVSLERILNEFRANIHNKSQKN